MKPTQKSDPKGQAQHSQKSAQKKNEWQIPERTQVIITPGAEKSLEKAAAEGERVRIVTDRRPDAKAKSNSLNNNAQSTPAKGNGSSVPSQKSSPKPQKRKEPANLWEAVLDELRDRAHSLRLNIQLNAEDIIKGVICAMLLVFFALLQTTFFARFAPFGATPDLMLIFALAVGVYDGEKWGSVLGLCSAFVIQSLGGSGNEPSLLSLVYMPAGLGAGLLIQYYLSNTFPVKLMLVGGASLLKCIITVISASMQIEASLGTIILNIAIPEFFSTVLISPLPFFAVWLSLRHFHKTRAERTDSEQL